MSSPAPDAATPREADLLRAVLDCAPLGVAVLGLEGGADPEALVVVYANPTLRQRLAIAAEEAVEGRRLLELLPGLRGVGALQSCIAVAGGGAPRDLGEVTYGESRGAPAIFKGAAQPLPGGRVAVFLRDITRQRQAEEELGRTRAFWESVVEHKERLLGELDQQLDVIAQQQEQIFRLSAPVIELREGVLVVPIVGSLSASRSEDITGRLLAAVGEKRAWCVVLDLTGAEGAEPGDIANLLRMARAVGLMGARSVITGIRPAVAQAMVALGVDFGGVTLRRSLREALEIAAGPARAPGPGPGPGSER